MSASAVVPSAAALAIVLAFVVVQEALRADAASRTLRESAHDRGTTRLIGVSFVVCCAGLLAAAPLNQFEIGTIEPRVALNIAGLALMLGGLAVRVAAARALGRFYTRTLRTSRDQRVVSSGPYRRIRHPGYLGDIVLFLAAGVAVSNLVAIALVAASTVPAYLRRIAVEERMLKETLGREWDDYAARTKRLIPFIY